MYRGTSLDTLDLVNTVTRIQYVLGYVLRVYVL